MAKSIKAIESAESRKWQAESDARTLASAAEIAKDRARAKRAVTAAKKMATDAQKTAKTVTKQAGVKRRKRK